jgi:hypothetical protein
MAGANVKEGAVAEVVRLQSWSTPGQSIPRSHDLGYDSHVAEVVYFRSTASAALATKVSQPWQHRLQFPLNLLQQSDQFGVHVLR